MRVLIGGFTIAVLSSAYLVTAQPPPPPAGQPAQPPQPRGGNNLQKPTSLNEKGEPINGVGDTPNRHDMLTGSQLDGTAFTDGQDHTCSNWTSNTAGSGSAQLGHSDRTGGGNMSWN